MKNICEKFERMMTDALAGELSADERKLLDQHLAECGECAANFAEMRHVWELASLALTAEPMTDKLSRENHDKIFATASSPPSADSEKEKSRIRFVWMEIAASFILLAILTAALLPALSSSGSRTKSAPVSVEMRERQLDMLEEIPDPQLDVNMAFDEFGGLAESSRKAHEDMSGVNAFGDDDFADEEIEIETEEDAIVSVRRYGGSIGMARAHAAKAKREEPGSVPAPTRPLESKMELETHTKYNDGIRMTEEKAQKLQEKSRAKADLPSFRYDQGVTQNSSTLAPQPSPAREFSAAESGEFGKDSFFGVEDEPTKREAWKAPAPRELVDERLDDFAAGEKEGFLDLSLGDDLMGAFDSDSMAEESTGQSRMAQKKLRFPKSGEKPSQPGGDAGRPDEELRARRNIAELNNEMPESARDQAVPAPAQVEEQAAPMETGSFSLDLKLWDLTDEDSVRDFLRRKNANFAENVKIRVISEEKRLELRGTKKQLKQAGEFFDKLLEEEERLRSFENGIPFIPTKQKPVSTFSIDVDTASYTMARKELRQGRRPDPEIIRPEEFINYFDYHYRSPDGSVFGVYLEAAPAPFRPQNRILRIGVQGQRLAVDVERPSVFTILIDTSGSMGRDDRIGLVKQAIPLLLEQMRPEDKVAVILCRHRSEVLIPHTPVSAKKTIGRMIEGIRAYGVTNIESGLVVAYNYALENYQAGASNRVIVFTDGIISVGSANAQEILGRVEKARRQGISNTIIGLGGDGDDSLLEALANRGDGSYIFLSDIDDAREVFSQNFASRFHEIAKDVKIQVEFNPEFVPAYRQVGYHNRQLSRADFRNDKVDAGEVGAGQSVTALYELRLPQAVPQAGQQRIIPPLAVVRLRYRRVDTMEIEEREFYLSMDRLLPSFQAADPGFKLAALVAEFAEHLRYPDVPGIATPSAVYQALERLGSGFYRPDSKVRELLQLVAAVK